MHRTRELVLMLILLLAAGCRQQQVSVSDLALDMTASDLLVGQTTLLVTVRDQAGNPVADPGRLQVRGDMNHAGMVPVLAEADSATDGVFSLPFVWTMGGSWTVEANLQVASGEIASATFPFEILSEATDDRAEMDHDGMDQAPSPSENSAVYMHIYNSSERDITLVSAESAAAQSASFHRTVLADDDMARMEALEQLRIPAGETVELVPGGRHIMLLGLIEDLSAGGHLRLELRDDAGRSYRLQAPVMAMPMGAEGEVKGGDLRFSQIWARAGSAGGGHAHSG